MRIILSTSIDKEEYFLSVGGKLVSNENSQYTWEFSEIPDTYATCGWLRCETGKQFPISETVDGEKVNGRSPTQFGRWKVVSGELVYEFSGEKELPIKFIGSEARSSLPLTREEAENFRLREEILRLRARIADLEETVRKRNRQIKWLREAVKE
ncbi:MAG: hypothetical protein DDT23_01016 [candidate division WS2 bacterium]|nr:hypothetical protein [Candidatus Lithacetigena glycinireducens]